jgi:hypothetical protein
MSNTQAAGIGLIDSYFSVLRKFATMDISQSEKYFPEDLLGNGIHFSVFLLNDNLLSFDLNAMGNRCHLVHSTFIGSSK